MWNVYKAVIDGGLRTNKFPEGHNHALQLTAGCSHDGIELVVEIPTLYNKDAELRPEGRGVEGLKMPYSDFSICYRAGRDEPNAKSGMVNLTFPSRDIAPQRLGFTCNCKGSLIFTPSYLCTVFSTSTPLLEELARSCGLKLGRCVPWT